MTDVPHVTLSTPSSPGTQREVSVAQPTPLHLAKAEAAFSTELKKAEEAVKKEKENTEGSSWRYICKRENRPALINSAILINAYVLWYFCRSHISAASADLEEKTLSGKTYATMQALSYGSQLFSKLISGAVVDYFNTPKLVFLFFGLVCVLATVINIFWHTEAGYLVLYPLIKGSSSFSRIAVLKIMALWYPFHVFGTVGSIIQMGSCVGEMAARLGVGALLKVTRWEYVWTACAAVSMGGLIPVLFFVRQRPPPKVEEIGIEEGINGEENLALPKTLQDSEKRAPSPFISTTPVEPKLGPAEFFKQIVLPLLMIPKFHAILVLSFVSTAIREAIITWSPYFYKKVLSADGPQAAMFSSMSGFFALLSIALGGHLVDTVSKKRKGLIPLVFFIANGVCLFALYAATRFYVVDPNLGAPDASQFSRQAALLISLIQVTCFALAAPTSLLDGAYAVELGGTRAASFAAGLASSIGYLGATLSALFVRPMISSYEGWIDVWFWMVVLGCICILVSIIYAVLDYAEYRSMKLNEKKKKKISLETS